MATTTMVHVRVDDETKAQATEALAAMGLSVSDAVRDFLKRVVARPCRSNSRFRMLKRGRR